jgi:hypothetical protein
MSVNTFCDQSVPDELPLGNWQQQAERVCDGFSGRVRYCAKNAFVHLRKAWRIRGLDHEMAAFRIITAEEEAATAVILSLKQKRYAGADRLNPRQHQHKCAIWPLISTVNHFFHEMGIPTTKLSISLTGGKPKITAYLNLSALAGNADGEEWIELDYPLNFSVREGGSGGSILLFKDEFATFAKITGAQSIRQHFITEANARNLLLYANDDGIPAVNCSAELIMDRAKRVSILVLVAAAILQSPTHQIFVSQCVEAMLRALDIGNCISFEYPDPDELSDWPLLTIDRSEGDVSRLSIRTKMKANLSVRWNLQCYPYHWVV